jgi:GntR family transcriptional regulator, rspAB operon transcriptional repressor
MTDRPALLKEQAYEELKALIVSGELPPGTFLSERTLATRLGMSKTPVRTALERLQMERFVTISPQQGIIVRGLSLAEINDHYDLRIALETFVVSKLAGRLTPDQSDMLEENLRTTSAAASSGDKPRFMALDTEFHLMLCESLGNQEIVRVMEHQRDKFMRVIMPLIERHGERLQATLAEHTSIVDAVRRGDGRDAAARVAQHLNNGRRLLVSS